MLPIKIKNESSFVSDISLFTLLDKETQTSKCVSKQGSSAINIYPDATEQNVVNLLDYGKIISKTGVFDTKVHKENIIQHKQVVDSAESSHSTFPIGNIYQREKGVEPQSTGAQAWKLDESLDRESNNSGYIYVPCASAKDNEEDVSNNACIFMENKPSITSENKEEDKSKSSTQASFQSAIGKEKVSARIGFTCIPIKKANDSIIEMANKKPSNEDICPSSSELAAKRLNYMAQEIKTHLSSTLSAIMDPICNGACRQQRMRIEELSAKKKAEEQIIAVVKPDPPEVQPNPGVLSRIRKSWSNLVCGPCPSCEAKLISQEGQKVDPPKAEPLPEEKKEEEKEEKKEEEKEEKDEKPPCSPNKLCGPVITYPCPPPPRPRNCGFDNKSAQSLEFKSISPLFNEMSPNNEFVSEEYVFNNNDHASPIIHMSLNRNEHVVIPKHTVNVSDLSAVASSIKDDDYIHSKPENVSMIKDNTIQKSDHSGPIAKIMDVVESTVLSLKEHIDLDRISYYKKEDTKSQDKAEQSTAPSSEYFIRAVAPEAIAQSHQFIPPRRSLFTSFKSTIFRFFGDGEKFEEPLDISSSSDTSEMSDDSTNDESN